MRNLLKIIGVFGVFVCMSSCLKEDFFGKTKLNQILYFSLNGQVGNTRIVQDSLKIYVTVRAGADIKSLTVDSVALSTFASISPEPKKPHDFSVPFNFIVTAEDGSTTNYTILVKQEGANPQLENSGFDDWYTPEGKSYQQPGKDASTIWASANEGVTATGAGNFNTTPLFISGPDYAAKLVTKDLGFLAQITGQRMGSATLFTGKFTLNISNPTASAQFGIPFTAKPTGFSIDYNYQAGTLYKDGSNKEMNKIDSADLYVVLENRKDPQAIKRIATGWFRSGNSANEEFKTITVPLIYGPLPGNTPEYQKPLNNLYGSTAEGVTHISVVFASSANGIVYEGAVGSTLVLNNFVLNY